MRFDGSIIGDLLPFFIAVVIFGVVISYSTHLVLSTRAELTDKLIALEEDIVDPQILSESTDNVERKTFTLLNLDNNYYIGQGFINGKLYYIFRVKEKTTERGYEAVPVSDSKFVYDGKNIVEVTKTNITQKYRARVDNQVKTREISKNHYVFHVPNSQIKDYGVIQQEVDRYSSMFFFPIVIPFVVR